MNGTPSDNEKLSAWLDDQLPLDERAEVEKLLVDSPELRQEVEELRRLSGLVKGLPKEKAPAELQQAVMRSIERETLLAGSGSADSGRQRRVLQLLTAAAGIAVVVGLGTWFASNVDQNIAGNNQPTPQIVHVEQSRPSMQANKADLKNTATSESPLTVELPDRQFELDRDSLSDAAIGDIVRAVRRDGDSVSIVRLTVVDRQAGFESLRVLLAHQDIKLDGESENQVDGGDGFVAVYMQSEPEQLSRTIEQMARRIEFGALSVSESLPIAGLDSGAKSELGLSDVEGEAAESKAVAVRDGSAVEKLISEPGSYEAASDGSPDSEGQPVRVIFVLTDAPELKNDADPDPSNGAA